MKKNHHLNALYLLLAFNFVFILFEVIVLTHRTTNFTRDIAIPWTSFAFELTLTIVYHFSLFIILSLVQWLAYIATLYWVFPDKNKHDSLLTFIWSISILCIYLANYLLFPQSMFAKVISPYFNTTVASGLFVTCFALLLIFGFLIISYCYRCYKRTFFACLSLLVIFSIYINIDHANVEQSDKPNVLFIGIDSLKLSEINQQLTPNIYHFIQSATVFKQSITPLARTYPALTSLLTGLYPKSHGAHYNLMPQQLVSTDKSLAWKLKQAGYTTIFASDDRRFSTIDKDYGFDTVIGPKLGINDILIGNYNDFPLTNLFINTTIGKWLYPYNYANRANHITYYPLTFSRELDSQLNKITASPIFLMTHFTLAHWPYSWASTSEKQAENKFAVEGKAAVYRAALHQVDKQFGMLMQQLNNSKRLDNAFIVLFSDHGEVLYQHGSRITQMSNYQGTPPSPFASYLANKTDTELDKSSGHGSDLLSPEQFLTLLSFKIMHNHRLINQEAIIQNRVSILDIKPTVANYLKLTVNKLDGISLLPAILYHKPITDSRSFYLESGMLPNRFLNAKEAVKAAKRYFIINPTNHQLQINPEAIDELNKLKLYGILSGPWLLTLYPDDSNYLPVLINLTTKQWVDNLNTPFAKQSPAQTMLEKLLNFNFPKSKQKVKAKILAL